MRSFVIGTAGHIDHGKSSLVKALTGTDPDRLKGEKERGITIDLGFAHAPLSTDIVASFVDVPGHEKFVRHMLAGAGGIDAVILAVAATEGVMPQTREHFHICRLLGIQRGVVVLTKVDVAEDATIERAERSIRELVGGSFLDGAPIVRTSVRDATGLQALRASLLDLASQTPLRSTAGLLRLSMDRVFSLKGFGTVVTGTLLGGSASAGDELVVLPSGKTVRVRGLHVHGTAVERVVAGERTAMNLASVLVSDLSRGDVIVRRDTFQSTRVAHLTLRALEGTVIKHGARVRVHAGSAEILGRIRMDAGEVRGGEETFAEIRFETPAVLGRGDRVIIRSYSPLETIGGATVLDPAPRPRRRAELASLAAALKETDAEASARFLRESGPAGLDSASLAARLAMHSAVAREILSALASAVRLAGVSDVFIDVNVLAQLEGDAAEALRALHDKDPLAKGMSREELRRRVFAKAAVGVFETGLRRLAETGVIADSTTELVTLVSHRVTLSAPDASARLAIETALSAAGLAGLSLPTLHTQLGLPQKASENAIRVLVQEKTAERLGPGLLVLRSALEAFRSDARARFVRGSKLDVAEVKTLTGLSRKYVIPLLEWLDRERVTRRVGAERIVL